MNPTQTETLSRVQGHLDRWPETFAIGVCGYCGGMVDEHRQGHDHEVPPSSSSLPDGERPKVRVVAANIEVVRRSDYLALREDAQALSSVLKELAEEGAK